MILFGYPITHYNLNNNHIKAYGVNVNNKLVNRMDDIGTRTYCPFITSNKMDTSSKNPWYLILAQRNACSYSFHKTVNTGKLADTATKLWQKCRCLELRISWGVSSKTLEVSKTINLTKRHLKPIIRNVSLMHLYNSTTIHYQYDTPTIYHYLHILLRKYLYTGNIIY